MSKPIVIPITEANRQGIDGILDAVREIFTANITEAYIVETDDPGMIAVATRLAEKSGNIRPSNGSPQPARKKPGPHPKSPKGFGPVETARIDDSFHLDANG